MKSITGHITVSIMLVVFLLPLTLRAHCDTLEGPVVQAAREALDRNDVTPVLKWVKESDETAIKAAFSKVTAVRKQSKEAADLADVWFFETLVRIHRAGEGAPYTGLKTNAPAEPGIEAADHALESGNIDGVLAETTRPLNDAIRSKFEQVMELKKHAHHSVAAGREFVEAYVGYVHFIENLASLATKSPSSEHAEHHH